MTGTIADLIRDGAARLRGAGVPDPGRDARLLMAAALGVEGAGLTSVERDAAPEAAAEAFARFLAERGSHRPVSQILGRRAFWGRDFRVTADVLDPRPETETLVELALAGRKPARILDLGTGSGALLVTLLAEWPEARGLGIEASPAALAVARDNAVRLGVADRADFRIGDWCAGLDQRFDLVLCNPPYIPEGDIARLEASVRDWEPRMALSAGPSGLESYREIAENLARILAANGRALFEIGFDQGESVSAIFRAAGFRPVLYADLAGKPRCLDIST